MRNLTKNYWNSIGNFEGGSFGVGTFGDGGVLEEKYRHFFEVKNIKSIVSFNKTMNVLELGCGSGRFAYEIAPYVKKYVGIDYSGQAINIAKQTCSNGGIKNVEFLEGSASEFRSNEKFDVIYFGGMIQYLKDEEIIKLLDKLGNNVKKNTIIIDRSTVYKNIRHISDSILYYCIYRTPEEIESIFQSRGYELKLTKPSYEFLKGTNKLTKKMYNNMEKYDSLKFHFMRYVSKTYRKMIVDYKKANYLSHDYFVFKKEKHDV